MTTYGRNDLDAEPLPGALVPQPTQHMRSRSGGTAQMEWHPPVKAAIGSQSEPSQKIWRPGCANVPTNQPRRAILRLLASRSWWVTVHITVVLSASQNLYALFILFYLYTATSVSTAESIILKKWTA